MLLHIRFLIASLSAPAFQQMDGRGTFHSWDDCVEITLPIRDEHRQQHEVYATEANGEMLCALAQATTVSAR